MNKRNPRQNKKRISPKNNTNTPPPSIEAEIRLNKYLAHAGIASRRKADEYILQGKVKVNGKIVTQAGTKVQPGDHVEFEGEEAIAEKKVYVLLNKPRGVITSTQDEKGRRTIMELLKGVGRRAKLIYEPRLYPVGRLDRETTGLLLCTNDGDAAQRLMHPSKRVPAVYKATLNIPLSATHKKAIEKGIDLDGVIIKAEEVAFPDDHNKKEVGIEIHSAKNDAVRRIFVSLGYEVVHLDRMLYAGLTKKDVPRGKWRFLTPEEVIQVKYLNQDSGKTTPQ